MFKASLNNKLFKRNKHRKILSDGYFSDFESVITWISRISVAIFFTPVVAVSAFFTKNSFMAFFNVVLALVNIANFIYRAMMGYISVTESILTTISIILAVMGTVLLTPGFAPSVLTFTSFMYSIVVLATATNSLFSIKSLVLPTFKKIVESILKIFGVKYKDSLIKKNDFDIDKDKYVLNRLLKKHFDHDCTHKDVKRRIKLYNNMLGILIKYLNKYNDALFGNIANRAEISQLEKIQDELTNKGEDSNFIKFIDMKIDFKETKLSEISQGIETLESAIQKAESTGDLNDYNKLIGKYFIHVDSLSDSTKIETHSKQPLTLLREVKEQQEKKLKRLKKASPKHFKKLLEAKQARKELRNKHKAYDSKDSESVAQNKSTLTLTS